jgi:hypothetical protein
MLYSYFIFENTHYKLYINYQLDAQINIYSYNITFLYMFRATNAHLYEVTLFSLNLYTDGSPRPLVEIDGTICCMYTM